MSNNEQKHKQLLAHEDVSLWDSFAQDIKPLPSRQKNIVKTKKGTFKPVTSPRLPIMSDHLIEPSRHLQNSAKIDNNKRRDLVRSKIEIEARLDLHGLTQEQAHSKLKSFIFNCYQHRKRFVLVITGKGKSEDGYGGILKRIVPYWLQAYDLAPYVIGFEPAHSHHGGSGALYMWIRKQREKLI
jgi:DNA-nicking Smr family endonuclease